MTASKPACRAKRPAMPVEKHFGKLQFPMEEAVLLRDPFRRRPASAAISGSVVRRAARRIIRQRLPERRIHRHAEMRRGHQVGQPAVLAGERLAQAGIQRLLLLHLLYRTRLAALDQPHIADRKTHALPETRRPPSIEICPAASCFASRLTLFPLPRRLAARPASRPSAPRPARCPRAGGGPGTRAGDPSPPWSATARAWRARPPAG